MASSCKNKTPDTVISWVPARAGACILDRRGQRAEARGHSTRTYHDPPAPTRTYRGPTEGLPKAYRREAPNPPSKALWRAGKLQAPNSKGESGWARKACCLDLA